MKMAITMRRFFKFQTVNSALARNTNYENSE